MGSIPIFKYFNLIVHKFNEKKYKNEETVELSIKLFTLRDIHF